MNILVFGGNGFLGLEIEKVLKNANHVFFQHQEIQIQVIKLTSAK
jgi:dTDP-4-dehydrorhamnose reductase